MTSPSPHLPGSRRYRISVDTGGTFTDVVLVDEAGEPRLGKALTTPHRAFEGIGAGLETLADQEHLTLDELLARTETFIYGTTRSTNAIVEKKTARTAFFTSAGFPDTLLLKEGGKPDPFRQLQYPAPIIPRRLTWEITGRIDADGSVYTPLDEQSVRAAIAAALSRGCEAIAVCLLWSIANPDHELAVGALIEEMAPGVPYTLSHQLNPIIREYRRASSTAIDASLKPLMQEHLTALNDDLAAHGFTGHLLIATSYGGCWPIKDMIERPIYSIGSGPSLAPVAARAYSAAEAESRLVQGRDLLVCDTGGTTFDVGVVTDGDITYTNETWLGGRWIGDITGTRAVDVTSIGSGGGSLIWIDPGGLLRVGPHSAGSVPGPACYGRGGTRPTITDASLALGYLDADNFLGGAMKLDRQAAYDAIDEHVAQPLGMSVEEAAWAALVIACSDIVGAIRATTISKGIDPREVLLVAGGGASGLNIGRIASELGCDQVLLPRTAGALSACGGVHSDIVSEFPVSGFADTGTFDFKQVDSLLRESERRAQQFLDSLGDVPTLDKTITFTVEARYRMQVWELDVPLSKSRITTDEDLRELEEAFHAVHEKVFAVSEPGQHLECLVWKARATAAIAKPAISAGERPAQAPEPISTGPAYFDSEIFAQTPSFHGPHLAIGTEIAGPAVVREPTTTIVVYPEHTLRVTDKGNYLLTTKASQLDDDSKDIR